VDAARRSTLCVEILGVEILGVEILGVEILGVEILGVEFAIFEMPPRQTRRGGIPSSYFVT
jgi:hypothetical protein